MSERTSDRETLKREAAEAALEFVRRHSVIGVGSGSTVALFVEALGRYGQIEAAVAASNATAEALRHQGIRVVDLDDAGEIGLYIDSADEADHELRLIKGAGGAMTREKLLAKASARFVCAIDAGKLSEQLGRAPVPVEVLPEAEGFVTEELASLGGRPEHRANYVTDNGNFVLDATGLPVHLDPEGLERVIDAIPGVVGNGIFAVRRADVLVVGEPAGVRVVSG